MTDPHAICECLAPYLSETRIARMEGVLERRTREITLVVDRLHKAHNYMAILRTAEALGIQDVHIIPDPNDSPSEINGKLTQGAHIWLTLHVHPTWQEAYAALRGAGYKLYTSYLGEGTGGLETLDLKGKIALLFGNELEGFTPEQVAAADGSFILPMEGFTQSFNVSVACALALQRLIFARESQAIPRGALADQEKAELRAAWYMHSVRAAEGILALCERRRSVSSTSP